MPPSVQILRGGAPVKNTILVNVDDETVTGDGSIENPLRAVGGGGAITTEHIEVPETDDLDPAITVTFVAYNGLVPEISNPFPVGLADGTTDGQQKEVIFASATNVQWRLTPANFANSPGSYVQFPSGETGGALLTWDAITGFWSLVSTFNGTVV